MKILWGGTLCPAARKQEMTVQRREAAGAGKVRDKFETFLQEVNGYEPIYKEIFMNKYEYKFVEIPRIGGLKVKSGDTFEDCKKVIISEAEQGWRLKQVVTPFDEKSGVFASKGYQVIFERER